MIYKIDKLTIKQRKELKEILNIAKNLLTNAEEQYKEVIRKN